MTDVPALLQQRWVGFITSPEVLRVSAGVSRKPQIGTKLTVLFLVIFFFSSQGYLPNGNALVTAIMRFGQAVNLTLPHLLDRSDFRSV